MNCFLYFVLCFLIVYVLICIVMVGLLVRGKIYVLRKFIWYFNWIGVNIKVFNFGEYCCEMVGVYCKYFFFDLSNMDGMNVCEKCVEFVLEDIIKWLNDKGQVVIFDVMNII